MLLFNFICFIWRLINQSINFWYFPFSFLLNSFLFAVNLNKETQQEILIVIVIVIIIEKCLKCLSFVEDLQTIASVMKCTSIWCIFVVLERKEKRETPLQRLSHLLVSICHCFIQVWKRKRKKMKNEKRNKRNKL